PPTSPPTRTTRTTIAPTIPVAERWYLPGFSGGAVVMDPSCRTAPRGPGAAATRPAPPSATLAHASAGDAVALLALIVLLVVAFRHLRGLHEASIALVAVGACLVTGATTFAEAGDAVRQLFPVVAFLAAILVVSGACADLGLFRAIGQRLGRRGTSGTRFLGMTFLAAVSVTAVLSLDATVVLLTPVVLAAATRAGVRPGPALSACVRL